MVNLPHVVGDAILVLVPMILSLTVHEFAHAWVATRLHDDTPRNLGRLTLNPLAHADLMGTILLPLLILVANGATGLSAVGMGLPFLGWAKPVPVNPTRFRRSVSMRTGMMLVAFAGPIANLILSFICLVIYTFLLRTGYLEEVSPSIRTLLFYMFFTNIGLFVFNMIPVYPLDGQKVLAGLLPRASAERFEHFNLQFGWILLLGLIFMGRNILALPIMWVSRGLLNLVGIS